MDKVWTLWYNSHYGPNALVGMFPSREDAERAERIYTSMHNIIDCEVEYTYIDENKVTTFTEWNVDHIPTD